MDKKLFKKTYPFICAECGTFTHTINDFCEKCGAKNSLHKASKQAYENM